jgi:putative sugar O-methyltransferase
VLLDRIRERFIRANQSSQREQLRPQDAARIDDMFQALADAPPQVRPSRYWEELNKMNVAQLKEEGFENLKRTIALNYFTWARIFPWDSQIIYLSRHVGAPGTLRAINKAIQFCSARYFSSVVQSFSYALLTNLLWEYILAGQHAPELLALEEPQLGTPAIVTTRDGMRVSQDLGNSLLEYESFHDGLPADGRGTVLELGGGYGRNAFVLLKLYPGLRYVAVDIPPALWVAEEYLSRLFPERRIFPYRTFKKFEEVAAEYDRADLLFLLSSQLATIPAASVDLVLNISSLHEMRKDQIDYYFSEFDRVLKPGGHAYIKEWKEAKVLFENVTLTEEDYPCPPGWKKIVNKTAAVQTRFFETLYKKSPA